MQMLLVVTYADNFIDVIAMSNDSRTRDSGCTLEKGKEKSEKELEVEKMRLVRLYRFPRRDAFKRLLFSLTWQNCQRMDGAKQHPLLIFFSLQLQPAHARCLYSPLAIAVEEEDRVAGYIISDYEEE